MKYLKLGGIILSSLFMLFAVPYAILEYFDKTLPYDSNLLFFAGISIFLFTLNLYYYKRD